MASPGAPSTLSSADERLWRKRLLRGDWRVWDLELFQVLCAALSILTALLASVLVVAMTHHDGNVRISVLFVASLVGAFVVVRGAARAGLHAAERRTAATAALEARRSLLDAVGRGATLRPGAASTFVSRSAADVGDYLARAIPARVVGVVVPVMVLAVLVLVDPWSAAIAAAVALMVPVVMASVGRRAAAEAETGLTRLRSLGGRALELLEGAVELRALDALDRGRAELAAATERTVASTRRSLRIGLRSSTWLDVLAGTAVGLVAMIDGFRLLSGSLDLGHGLAAVLLTVEVFVPLRAAGAAFHAGADGRAALAMLAAAFNGARPARSEPTSPLPDVASSPAAIVAEDVTLAAAPDGVAVIQALVLNVPAKGALVVTGASGAGKTTLLRALAGAPLRLGGVLRVGNADPGAWSARQRSSLVAMVDQQPFVLDGSIRENLVLGSSGVADDALDDAVRRCGLEPLLARAPDGLDTRVGEGGRLVSAGERTRIALARAVLRAPGVLLLDEVCAHLDDAAIAGLRSSLAEFLSSRTVVEAAHDRPLLEGAPRLVLASLAVAP